MGAGPGSDMELVARPSAGIAGDVRIPGDKSMSHRSLILGALAQGSTSVEGLLESDDVLATLSAVRALGAAVEKKDDGSYRLEGAPWHTPSELIDCGNSGTGVRLLMGAAAGFELVATFTGDQSLRGRPMGRVTEPLAQMGARFDRLSHLPVTLRGGRLAGIRYRSPTASAQVKSAILLAGLRAQGEVEVLEPVPSRDHTEHMLRHFGCDVQIVDGRQGRLVRLGPDRSLRGTAIVVPGDPSSAAFPLVAALVTPNSQITLRNVVDSPLRSGLFDTLLEMGADMVISNRREQSGTRVMDISAASSKLRAVRVPKERAPSMIDEYPILAVAAAFAAGETVMEGVGELRVKESDRLAAILGGLKACGVAAKANGDTLTVKGLGGPPPGGGAVRTEGDHRIAMSFLTLGLGALNSVEVDQARMISTSFPGFQTLMRSLGADIEAC